ncbi:cellulose synthase complex periplasmic endoglucanase BcsZ [Serratia plymuthica]|uniref:cellulose synthase complex periplasmic endoglucanase BcsZ n=1 Tax=Serratia plymuthica TaxID=82996 RepID=UPI0004563776|nr:cellulose synthase complex periplasmic endoglucanase BcsZ [Serratia plymuthica]AHY05148.1 endo-1,4-D-glucanase [Serratia plymuthica]MBL3525440.1 cellulase [Serratia plymuthica]MEB6541712.1 cellulose synthase complex periplasmic endoglucanase BcsZ [Serratia plymuthica]
MSATLKRLTFGMLLLCAFGASAACEWPAWQQYKQFYISDEGRVIDPSSPNRITTSEGQSYGLFFALVANDRPTFDKLLEWTENNLAAGDLSAHLPAWLWGEDDKKRWTVLDTNTASDADLWIAYNLLEAGRLWKSRRYQTLGTLLLQRIGREEVADIPGLGLMLLPGKVGFVAQDRWRLNPSYLPPQLLARFAALNGPWRAMQKTNQRLLLETAPHGFSPDWVVWQAGKGWQPDTVKPNVGSYDAIRVYLWVGMLADDDEHKAALVKQLLPMAQLTAQQGVPPEKTDTASGKTSGDGPVGFSAVMLPMLANQTAALDVQRQRINQHPPGDDAYFSASLTLFGQGWDQQRYRFNRQGELQPAWGGQCVTSK